ncbi:MAG: DUF948 domain-containing protein [Nitrospinae bacterium]|nr:DUF948 domain-containing protein [Nitrospinota bacterium]
MTFTVTLTELSFFLIAIGLLALVVYLIPAIIQLRQTLKTVQELSEESRKVLKDTIPVINKVKGQLDGIGDTIEKFKTVGKRLPDIANIAAAQVKKTSCSGGRACRRYYIRHKIIKKNKDLIEHR